jgi:hypothetical protein
MKKTSRQQEKAIQKIWESQTPFFFLLIIGLVAALLILSSTKHPKRWIEKNIVLQDVSKVYITRGSYWKITDSSNATYSIDSSNPNIGQLVPGESYLIRYSPLHWNRIQCMTGQNTVIVEYEDSVRDYLWRTVIGWSSLGIFLCIAASMIWTTQQKIRKIKGNR